MKCILIKIIFGFCIVFSLIACHTFEHQNIFIQNNNKKSNEKSLEKKIKKKKERSLENKNKNSKSDFKKNSNNSEMAPINLPKPSETVQKTPIQKQVKIPNANNFSLHKFVNWNEERLIKTLGNSHFIKEEGKLKNYQYHFEECFVDVFLIRNNGIYLVNYVETRPTKLNGTINIKACFEEINQQLN